MTLTKEDINLFIEAVQSVSTYDFSDYSIKSFTRRIEKIVSDNNFDINTLIKKIKKSDKYLEEIVKEITVNTTELFRDPQMWQVFAKIVQNNYSSKDKIKIWHAGCSTGQEVYSLQILMHQLGLFDKTEVYASDINEDVLNVARSGKYKYRDISEYVENFNEALKDLPKEKRRFEFSDYIDINKRRDVIKIKSFLTKKPNFFKHDLVNDKNLTDIKFDIIMCRNVLIYFNHDLQNKIFEFFHDNLDKNGSLVIGRHEGILGPISNKFKKKETIYIKKEVSLY